MGFKLDPSLFSEETSITRADRSLCLIAEQFSQSRESFAEMASKYGNLIKFEQETRPGMKSNQVLDLDGNSERLVSGRAELPLHSDGNILKTNVGLVFLYADEIKNLKYQGGTTIVDFKKALEQMPPHLKKVLDEEQFETLGIEKGYYPEGVEPYWFQMETYNDRGWTKQFNIYLN
ncbi:spore coat [Brachionus plicatilis]|uniref:Spore coat n=1 Tax=Brachionus plicatilis TaxID=10195 RepID=A0A3M7S6B5_BRAPC|nr:spore coat [Brachionus plicatilis]